MVRHMLGLNQVKQGSKVSLTDIVKIRFDAMSSDMLSTLINKLTTDAKFALQIDVKAHLNGLQLGIILIGKQCNMNPFYVNQK